MGTKRVDHLVNEVLEILQDVEGVQYTRDDVARKINEGEHVVGVLRPDALTAETDHELAAGTRQTLPARGVRLRGISHNRGTQATGIVDGAPIRMVHRETLDAIGAWRQKTPGGIVHEYCYDERDPLHFDVNPPVTTGVMVRLLFEQSPADYTFDGDTLDPVEQTISIGDDYAPALVEWALYRLLSRQDDATPAMVDGSTHYRNFFSMLGLSVTADAQASIEKALG